MPVLTARATAAREHVTRLRAAGRGRLGMLDLAPLLDGYGIPCATPRPAATAARAAAVARDRGFPVAVKVHSADISHKSEVGGVRLGLRSADEVEAAAALMLSRVEIARPSAVIEGVLVQPMVERGKELLLGMVRDSQFGPAVMVGFGGVYVEVLKDTAMRLCPLDVREAREMLDELRMAPLLRGVRGEEPVDMEALLEAICRFARLVVDLTDLTELEVNPLVAGATGVIAVDARASLAPPGA